MEFTIKDESGKQLAAADVLSACIRYLKNHMFYRLQQEVTGLEESDICWVITVPAIWNEPKKQFMRKAAVKVCYFI